MPVTCGVVKCGHRGDRDGLVKFYRLPAILSRGSDEKKKLNEIRRKGWVAALRRADLTESKKQWLRVCGKHFISGRPAETGDINNPDWIPSVNMGYPASSSRVSPYVVYAKDSIVKKSESSESALYSLQSSQKTNTQSIIDDNYSSENDKCGYVTSENVLTKEKSIPRKKIATEQDSIKNVLFLKRIIFKPSETAHCSQQSVLETEAQSDVTDDSNILSNVIDKSNRVVCENSSTKEQTVCDELIAIKQNIVDEENGTTIWQSGASQSDDIIAEVVFEGDSECFDNEEPTALPVFARSLLPRTFCMKKGSKIMKEKVLILSQKLKKVNWIVLETKLWFCLSLEPLCLNLFHKRKNRLKHRNLWIKLTTHIPYCRLQLIYLPRKKTSVQYMEIL